jgi:hypothetical protein
MQLLPPRAGKLKKVILYNNNSAVWILVDADFNNLGMYQLGNLWHNLGQFIMIKFN